MERQDIEYDSVADLRIAVSDDEDGDYYVADDMMEVPPLPGTVVPGAFVPGTVAPGAYVPDVVPGDVLPSAVGQDALAGQDARAVPAVSAVQADDPIGASAAPS